MHWSEKKRKKETKTEEVGDEVLKKELMVPFLTF